jgi:predicted nucleic acid-binding protein
MNEPRFIDTNVLLYSISRDPAEASKRDIAIALAVSPMRAGNILMVWMVPMSTAGS